MLYDKLAAPPEPGTLQEAICAIIYNAREQAAAIRLFLGALGSILNPNDRNEWLMRYLHTVYPYLADMEEEKVQITPQEFLDKVAKEGPWVIQKQPDTEELAMRRSQMDKLRRGEFKV